MKKKAILICIIVAVMLLGFLFKDDLICSYVSLRRDKLENYASQVLDNNAEERDHYRDHYGIWETHIHPENGMVEFFTGGWGLAPSSTYKGFYYSADNTHKLFSAAYSEITTMEIDGDYASWTDGTDNHGTSIRITENWFWFEASF